MKNLYNRVYRRLFSLSGQPTGNDLKRIKSLSGFVCGMIRKGSSHLPDIGSGLPQNIDANSKTVAAKRFVSSEWIDAETHYLPFLLAFLHGVVAYTDLRDGITIVIDGSQTGKDNATLMISLVWQNRGIPICWLVKSGSKGHFKAEDHECLLSQAIDLLVPILPKDIEVTVLGDGVPIAIGIDGIGLQELCLNATTKGWNYVLRTACNRYLYENGEEFQAKNITPCDGHDIFLITQVVPIAIGITKQKFKYVNFLCWHDKKKHEKPIYLISNLFNPKKIIEAYNLRYSIECLFKDLKSTSFNLHKNRLKNPSEVFNLIIIAAVAFILLTVLAFDYDTIEYRKKVGRVRNDRKVFSFFSFAYKLIDYFLDYDISFNFSFQFSKNSS